MKLILIRHGIAEDIFEASSDEERKLTPDGQKKFKKIAAGILKCEPKIDRVVSSPLVRAVQTAEIILSKIHSERFKGSEVSLSSRIRESDNLVPEMLTELTPNSDPHEFCLWLRKHYINKVDPSLAICGHEPHLSALLSFLLTGRDENFFEFKRGGAASLELYFRTADIKAQLNWFMKPSQLRSLV